MTSSTLANLIREPVLAGHNVVSQYADHVANRTGRFGGVFQGGKVTVADAFYHVGGEDIQLEAIPLAGIDPATHKVIIEPSKALGYAVRQTAPVEAFHGTIEKLSDLIPHKEVIAEIMKNVVDKNGKHLPCEALAISPSGDQMLISFPLELIDVFGDPVKQSLVVYNGVRRQDGAGVVLWSTPLRCTNQIAVMRMAAKSNKSGFAISGGKAARARFEDMLTRTSNFAVNAGETMLSMYRKMAEHQLTEDVMKAFISQTYPFPEMPKPSLLDESSDVFQRMQRWQDDMQKCRDNRELTMHFIEGGNGTAIVDPKYRYSLYAFLQGVSEVETKRSYKDVTTVTRQFVTGGDRGNRVAKAFGMCLETLARNKVTWTHSKPSKVKQFTR